MNNKVLNYHLIYVLIQKVPTKQRVFLVLNLLVVIKSISVVVSVGAASRATAEGTQKRWTEGNKSEETK